MSKLGVGSRGSWIRYKDNGRWEYRKHGKVSETVRHVAAVGVVACVRWDVAADCSNVTGILFREPMHYLTPTTGGSMSCCLPSLSCFLLLAGAPLWHSADHEFASGQKWTEDKEGYRLQLERDFFFHLPLFPLSVSHYLDSAGDMYWALVGSRGRRTSREQRHWHSQYDHHSKQPWDLLSP